MIKVGSDFSGVGAFNQALIRLGVDFEEVFACDMDKYARQTFIHNYGEPKYYPKNVYDREIPSESLDIYMTSPPCQAFSLAGKRLGKGDKRGILFFNSHEFIQENKPRYFIFENVKGLLSDDNGKTFQEWINYLGGKSVNGAPTIFPTTDAVPYHLYWKVINAKHHGVPQNRERVFLIGIRDDSDNDFQFPKEEHLTTRLKDVLEDDVDDKYFLSEKMINVLSHHKNPIIENENPNNSACIHAGYFKMGGRDQQYLKVKSGTAKGYEEATEGDYRTDEGFRWRADGNSPAIMAMMRDTWKENFTGQNPPIVKKDFKIRRLTPRECFRLMDFPDTFTWPVSDSQAYKQAGNSIVVKCLEIIINKFKL
jgi:DNA (cytosine-5)-methyltransferase 1